MATTNEISYEGVDRRLERLDEQKYEMQSNPNLNGRGMDLYQDDPLYGGWNLVSHNGNRALRINSDADFIALSTMDWGVKGKYRPGVGLRFEETEKGWSGPVDHRVSGWALPDDRLWTRFKAFLGLAEYSEVRQLNINDGMFTTRTPFGTDGADCLEGSIEAWAQMANFDPRSALAFLTNIKHRYYTSDGVTREYITIEDIEPLTSPHVEHVLKDKLTNQLRPHSNLGDIEKMIAESLSNGPFAEYGIVFKHVDLDMEKTSVERLEDEKLRTYIELHNYRLSFENRMATARYDRLEAANSMEGLE